MPHADENPLLVRQIIYIAHKEKPPHYFNTWHDHKEVEVFYIDYGTAIVGVNDKEEILKPGHCLLLPAKTKHRIRGDEGNPFNFLNLVFTSRVPVDFFSGTLDQRERQLLGEIKQEIDDEREGHELMQLLQLNEFLIRLMRHDDDQTPSPRGENRERYRNKLVAKAMDYLDHHLTESLDAKALAEQVGISPSHLRNLVSEETGKPLSKHHQERRIDKAKKLLRETQYNIKNVTDQLGFASVSHFSASFKRITGKTPTEYCRSLDK